MFPDNFGLEHVYYSDIVFSVTIRSYTMLYCFTINVFLLSKDASVL